MYRHGVGGGAGGVCKVRVGGAKSLKQRSRPINLDESGRAGLFPGAGAAAAAAAAAAVAG